MKKEDMLMKIKHFGFVPVIAIVLGITLIGLSGIDPGPALGWPGEPTPDEIVVRTPAPPPQMPTAVPLSCDSTLSSYSLCGQVQCDVGACGGIPFIECGTLHLFMVAPNLLPAEPPCGYLINFDNPIYHYDSSCGYYVLTGYSNRQILEEDDCSAC